MRAVKRKAPGAAPDEPAGDDVQPPVAPPPVPDPSVRVLKLSVTVTPEKPRLVGKQPEAAQLDMVQNIIYALAANDKARLRALAAAGQLRRCYIACELGVQNRAHLQIYYEYPTTLPAVAPSEASLNAARLALAGKKKLEAELVVRNEREAPSLAAFKKDVVRTALVQA
jgi:hypothetical protein